jgi:hypothetical protein
MIGKHLGEQGVEAVVGERFAKGSKGRHSSALAV